MKLLFSQLVALVALLPLGVAAQQYTQPIPETITEIRVSDRARLTVSEGPTAVIVSGTNAQVASVRGQRMHFTSSADITLPVGRSITFVAEDRSMLVFNGSFGKRERLTIHAEDQSSVQLLGSLADSVHAVSLTLHAEDHALISSDVRLCCYHFTFRAHDFARLIVACQQEIFEPGFESRVQSVSLDDNAHLDLNYCTGDSVISAHGRADRQRQLTDRKRADRRYADLHTPDPVTKKRSFWRHRDVMLNFGWGFHNWGSSMVNGFEGVDGAAAIRTSFNHIHLSVNYPLVGTRHTGLYVGLGLDWDKYKFDTPEVLFDPATASFTDGGAADCSSRLLTRYVVAPLTLRIDLWHDWHLSLAALPGIHWSGSHTGLRREYESDLRDELQKDPSVNRHIAPYKLDLRATLSYENIGLYLQFPTRSTMAGDVQELYPIRFGILFTVGD